MSDPSQLDEPLQLTSDSLSERTTTSTETAIQMALSEGENLSTVLIAQLRRFDSIERAIKSINDNADISLARLEVRRDYIKTLWSQCGDAHTELTFTAQDEDMKHRYFTEDLFAFLEVTVLDILGDIEARLRLATPATSSPTRGLFQDAAASTAVDHSNVRSTLRLPRIELPRFKGSYAEWDTFKDFFSTLVLNDNGLTNLERFHYLRSSLEGDALNLIKHLSITNANFQVAWDVLESRYANRRCVVHAHLHELLDCPSITKESAADLQLLHDRSAKSLAALRALARPTEHWSDLLVFLMVKKLDPVSRKAWELSISADNDYPKFDDFSKFLANRARALEALPTSSTGSKTTAVPTVTSRSRLAANVTQVQSHTTDTNSRRCPMCSTNHPIFRCAKFKELDVSKRHEIVKKYHLCTNCLGQHKFADCPSKFVCSSCKSKHHSLLHRSSAAPSPATESRATVSADSNLADNAGQVSNVSSHQCTPTAVHSSRVLLATAYVIVRADNGRSLKVRALIDQGSTWSLVSESLVQALRATRSPVRTVITGIGGTRTSTVRHAAAIQISPVSQDSNVLLTNALVLRSLTSYLPSKQCNVAAWPHLHGLPLADDDPGSSTPIQLLLGADLYGSLILDGLVKGAEGQPIAQRTLFGWVLSGWTSQPPRVAPQHTVSMLCHELRDLQADLRRFWEIEELPQVKPLDPAEAESEMHFRNTHSRDTDGRYIVRLPLRETPPQIGDSFGIASRALLSLERRLERTDATSAAYSEFMRDYEAQAHMSPVSCPQAATNPVVYLPHHGVMKESSTTTKLRVVFNASCATTNTRSLNDCLLVGRKLQADLSTVLTRWRAFRFIYSADIAQMYRQIWVDPRDRDYQRILWRYDTASAPQSYELNTVTFGVNCAPFLALRVLQQLVDDEGHDYPIAAQVMQTGLYVDDCLFGADDVSSAREIRDQLVALLNRGRFRLRKWASNSEELLRDIDPTDHGLACEKLLTEADGIKVLGIVWSPLDDTFRFRFNPEPAVVPTKRSILSTIAKLYDPLGWVGPVVIRAKMLLQSLWLSKVDWDEPVPEPVLEHWVRFRDDLPNLDYITIPRWVGTKSDSCSVEVLGFADASEQAYAAVVYVRSSTVSGNVTVSLLQCKTKVAPIKRRTIPQLELLAATLLAELIINLIRDITFLAQAPVYCWTDATIVLSWLSQHPSRWDTFVANRVSKIHTLLPDAQWRHVTSTQNPADPASRGTTATELAQSTLWWHGPPWLASAPSFWPQTRTPVSYQALSDTITATHVSCIEINDTLTRLSERVSSWRRLLRVTAWVRRWIPIRSPAPGSNISRSITVPDANELKAASLIWYRWLQSVQFPDEIKQLTTNPTVARQSPLASLNPYVDETGLLRVGGRLQMASLNYDGAHPIILRNHPVVRMMIRDAHSRCLHGSVTLTLRKLRDTVWVLQAKKLIRSVIFHCIVCARLKAEVATQLMGQLPSTRVLRAERPFARCGVDYAGPIQVRLAKGRGYKAHSAYICIFVCLSVKALHLELVSDYSSKTFIAAFKRFAARRGPPRDMYSDCGTTFVGANTELVRAYRAATRSPELLSLLAQDGTSWHFMPPAAPHFGGLWEAGVRSVKYHLKRVLLNQKPTFEELTTLLCEIEAVLNSRPLMALSDNPEDLQVLTPAHFLIGGPISSVTEPSTDGTTMSTRPRWKLFQQIRDRFWQAWSEDYVRSLQHRSKWRTPASNVRVGQLALLRLPNMPPAKWPIARVIACSRGPDDLVRKVTVRTAKCTYDRPISKIAILPVDDQPHD